MPSPRTPQDLEPDNGSRAHAGTIRPPAERLRASPVTRIQILAGGFLARHPTLLAVLESLGWNNPGGSMGP